MGIDTKFVVGGLEKWVVEGRDMDGLSARDAGRRCARFPTTRNRNTLLDTAQVESARRE